MPEYFPYIPEYKLDITKLDIYERCLSEVNDPNFDPGSHGSGHTYRQGCRGPMCTYARSTARTRGPGYLSNNLIELVTVYLWMDVHAREGKLRTIYEAPKNIRIYYARLLEHGLYNDLLENNGNQCTGYSNMERDAEEDARRAEKGLPPLPLP